MKIYISSGEKRISLSVNPTDTISQLKKYISDSREFGELKQKIFRRKEEKETTQYIIQNPQLDFNAFLLYRNSPLVDDRRTIDSYQIKEGETIKILRNYAPGGGDLCPINFVDVGKNVITHLEFSNNAPKWRIVKKGLNLFGICLGVSSLSSFFMNISNLLLSNFLGINLGFSSPFFCSNLLISKIFFLFFISFFNLES